MLSGSAAGAGGAGFGVVDPVVVVVAVVDGVVVDGVVVPGTGAPGAGAETVTGTSGVVADRFVSHTSPGSTSEISRSTRSQTSRLCKVALSVAIRKLRSEASAGFC